MPHTPKELNMRAAIYARYSTNMQSAASIDDQIRICREHAKRQGWTITETYSDAAISGANILRSGLQAALASARRGDFEILLAEALDRISRDQEDVAGIYKRLNFAGVTLFTLSEGEVGPLHVGLKGTMNALFLKDLADKTRRGMRGKLEKGNAVAGVSYGYSVTSVGKREINEPEAAVVHRIFHAYSDGLSPRAIARTLNGDNVLGPGGRWWGPSTIIGNRYRGIGVLNNELYIGIMVWNRQRFIKDPDTRKRLARPNPPDDWIRVLVPDLRIIDDDLWRRVKERQGAYEKKPFMHRRRPKHFLSGLIKCGCCGGGVSAINQTQLGCSSARDRGSCSNRRAVNRQDIEARILVALQRELLNKELFAEFCREYTREVNRIRMERNAGSRAREVELERVTRELDRCIGAITEGIPPSRVKDKMIELDARRTALMTEVQPAKAPEPYLHPNMADVYRRKVEQLADALKGDDLASTSAREALRPLIERVVLTPTADGITLDLVGDLAGILDVASGGATRGTAVLGDPSDQHIAGLGFEPRTFRL
jgi:site-specific DNA recombinase